MHAFTSISEVYIFGDSFVMFFFCVCVSNVCVGTDLLPCVCVGECVCDCVCGCENILTCRCIIAIKAAAAQKKRIVSLFILFQLRTNN